MAMVCKLFVAAISLVFVRVHGFVSPHRSNWFVRSTRLSNNKNDPSEEAARFREKAEQLREEARRLEEQLGGQRRKKNYEAEQATVLDWENTEMTLENKRVLVVGANGRLGSMVCRYLLRNNPKTQVVAAVHYIREESPSSRGWGRLSYEVGAEDGQGSIGPAWSENRQATFGFTREMVSYNLQNIVVKETELLDPQECKAITEGVDSIIWCATDFNGNKPRAITNLDVAIFIRAVTNPTKGRVEVEGLRNILRAFQGNLLDKKWGKTGPDALAERQRQRGKDPIEFVLVSSAPDAFGDFKTPLGTFNELKREGEEILRKEFPTMTYSILQMPRYEDFFVQEDLDVMTQDVNGTTTENNTRRINRRDAAKFASDVLVNEELVGKTIQLWTSER